MDELHKRPVNHLAGYSGTQRLLPTAALPRVRLVAQLRSSLMMAISLWRLIIVAKSVVPDLGAPSKSKGVGSILQSFEIIPATIIPSPALKIIYGFSHIQP